MSDCPRCNHPAETHWPNEQSRPTTACVICLDNGYHTFDPVRSDVVNSLGICCWTADAIGRHSA